MVHQKPPTYSQTIDAVAFHPGNVRDENAHYARTICVDAEGLAMPLSIDVDADGGIIMFEVMNASRAFPEAVLATFRQIDQKH